MKQFLLVIVLGCVAACGGGGATAEGTPSPAGATQLAVNPVDIATFTRLLNEVRRANGSSPVVFDARLAEAAQNHANDMRDSNFFSHTGSNGSSAGDRITAVGFDWRGYGENIAKGQRSEAEVLASWSKSPGHHANNINPDFETFGLATAGSGREQLWVLVLATEW